MAILDNVTLDFGAFPGSSHASVTVNSPRTKGAQIGNFVSAVVAPITTSELTAQEMALESVDVVGHVSSTDTIQIDAYNTSTLVAQSGPTKGKGTRLVGKFNVRCEWFAA